MEAWILFYFDSVMNGISQTIVYQGSPDLNGSLQFFRGLFPEYTCNIILKKQGLCDRLLTGTR